MRSTYEFEAKSTGNPSGKMVQNLTASEKLFHVIVQTATDAIILWDARGTIVLWNKGAHRMFGYSASEVVDQPLTVILPPRYHQAHHYGMERVESEGEGRAIVKTIELHGVRKDGGEFPIEMSPSKSVLEDETLYCGIIRDISERKQAEVALEERNGLLAFEAEVGHVLNRTQAMSTSRCGVGRDLDA